MCVNLNEYELLAWPSVVGRYKQGSLIGSLLFLIYINDLPNYLSKGGGQGGGVLNTATP